MKQDDAPVLYPKVFLMRAFLYIQKGDLTRAEHVLQSGIQTLGLSSSAILQWGALELFVYFLSGKRDAMLKRGEEIINDVPVVEGSSTGVYGYLILLFVTFAKGDVHKTRITFNDLAKSFSNGFKKTLLFSFEQDLVSLILCSFPMIFEQENKRQLMRRKEMEELLMVLKKKVLNRKNQKRSTFFLLKAKIFDQLQTKDARRYYKQALKLSNAMNHDLITCLSCLWYG